MKLEVIGMDIILPVIATLLLLNDVTEPKRRAL